jgi:hypothetical protein
MPQPKNALAPNAPEVTGINHLTDWVAQKLNPNWFPTSGRTLLETVQGNRTPITEKNFSPDELNMLRKLIELKGGDAGDIQYRDYFKLKDLLRDQGKMPISYTPSIFSMGDPLGNIQTTLGRFKYARMPNGALQVVDTYDFNPIYPEGATQEARTGEYGALGPYSLIRDYAGEKIPPGYGRNVKINLGK